MIGEKNQRPVFYSLWKLYEIQLSVSINKALLKHSCTYLFTYYLWLLWVPANSKIFYYLVLFRRNLPTPVLEYGRIWKFSEILVSISNLNENFMFWLWALVCNVDLIKLCRDYFKKHKIVLASTSSAENDMTSSMINLFFKYKKALVLYKLLYLFIYYAFIKSFK